MIKKRIVLIICIASILVLTACVKSDTNDSSQTTGISLETTLTESCDDSQTTIDPQNTNSTVDPSMVLFKKPVIYLYPKKHMQVEVKLDYDGELVCTYPEYKNGWSVFANPDGLLQDINTGKEYSYLFWEGISDKKWEITKGFVVSGKDTAEFLQEKLHYLGLLPNEYNEFIVYWLPQMQKNNYNLITFEKDEYEKLAKLDISPKPDSILRVFMVYKALEKPVDIEIQELTSFKREGFTVIEWGGTEVN